MLKQSLDITEYFLVTHREWVKKLRKEEIDSILKSTLCH